GSQCLSFFPHEGPGLIGLHLVDLDVLHQLLVELLGVPPGPSGEAEHGVEADAAEAGGGPPALALSPGLGDLQGLLLGQVGAEQGRPGPLREVVAAGGAAEAAEVAGLAGPAVGAEVPLALVAVDGAVGVGAGESRAVLLTHGALSCRAAGHPKVWQISGYGGKRNASPLIIFI